MYRILVCCAIYCGATQIKKSRWIPQSHWSRWHSTESYSRTKCVHYFLGLGWKWPRCEFHIWSWCRLEIFAHAWFRTDLSGSSSKFISLSFSADLFWIFIHWSTLIYSRWLKMDMNFSLNDNWSPCSRHRTIAVNSITLAVWWPSTNHYCVPSK